MSPFCHTSDVVQLRGACSAVQLLKTHASLTFRLTFLLHIDCEA